MSWRAAALIVLVGFQLRTVILAVPPVLPGLRSDLHLSFSTTGALTAIPVLGLGAASIPGAVLANRFGARLVVGVAALGLGVAAVLRITPPLPYSLFVWTAVLAVFVATAQPSIAVLVRGWFPDRVQQMATVYAMSLGLGGLTGSTLAVYLLAFGGWRGTFVLWAVPVFAAAVLWLRFAPGRNQEHVPQPHGLSRLARDLRVWHVAALFGGQSLVFYGGAAWIPFLLHGYSHSYLALVLFLFQVVGLPLSAAVATIRFAWATSRWWYVTGGVLMTAGTAGLMLGLTQLAWLWAPLMGLGNSMVFVGSNALPAILARERSDVAGYTAITLTVGYLISFLGPTVGGVLLDHTGAVTSPFWFLLLAAIATTGLGLAFSAGPRATPVAPAQR